MFRNPTVQNPFVLKNFCPIYSKPFILNILYRLQSKNLCIQKNLLIEIIWLVDVWNGGGVQGTPLLLLYALRLSIAPI